MARICYKNVDENSELPVEDGILLYIKAGLHGTEPMAILSYALTHSEFPHDTTANQFFTESQFESYRALGYEIARKALCYAERQNAIDKASPYDKKPISAKPLDKFEHRLSDMSLRDIVESLEKNLNETSAVPQGKP